MKSLFCHKMIGKALPALLLLFMLAGCKSPTALSDAAGCVSSKLRLSIPQGSSTFSIDGNVKLKKGEMLQLSLLMPILRSEVARIEITPDYLLLVDRMNRRYFRSTAKELRRSPLRRMGFQYMEKLLLKAAASGSSHIFTGKDLDVDELRRAKAELYDFSTKPLSIRSTELSSRYTQVDIVDLLEHLLSP